MSLNSAQRSKSAPYPLSQTASRSATPPSHHHHQNHKRTVSRSRLTFHSSSSSSHDDGFFHRSNSSYALNALADPAHPLKHPQHPPPPLKTDTRRDHHHHQDDSDSDTHLILSPTTQDPLIQSRIQSEDHVSPLVTSAVQVVTLPPLPNLSPRYEHDHLIHSYDQLHTTFCDKRRSATVPDLKKFGGVASGFGRKDGMYIEKEKRRRRNLTELKHGGGGGGGGGGLVNSTLFSPTEEKVDYFATTDEVDESEEEDDQGTNKSWTSYIVKGATRFLIPPMRP